MTDHIGSSTSRRALFAGAGAIGVAGVIAACGGDETPTSGDNPNTGPTGDGQATPAEPAPGAPFAKGADIPVGGGKAFGEHGVVITQPAAGEFVGFSNICTHKECLLADVSNGTINCGCHQSKFSIQDGSVKGGPAPQPLPKKDLKIDGDNISLA